jgi:DNA-binding response OmpR family regulator
MKRRILLVDDEVAVLLTLKAVLEISGFEVDTAASAKDARLKLKNREYAMVITDMRMENDAAGAEVIQAARAAEYHPAIALLTAFPVAEEDWQELETDRVEVLMKPMHTKVLLQQIESLLASHDAKVASIKTVTSSKSAITKKPIPKKTAAKKAVAGKGTKPPAKKAAAKAAKAR